MLGKELISEGATFGKLTVVEKGLGALTPHGHARMIKCKCACGEYGNVKAYQLVGGSRKCCGCSDHFLDRLTDHMVVNCKLMADSVGCSLGIAYNFIRTGVSVEEAVVIYKEYLDAAKTQGHGRRYQEGGIVGHAKIVKIAALRGVFCQTDAIFDELECICGNTIYVRQGYVKCGRLSKCACDHMTTRILGRLSKLLSVEAPKVEVTVTTQGAPRTRHDICQKGPNGEGLCRKYCDSKDDCLSYWAFGKATPNYRAEFACYQKPTSDAPVSPSNFDRGAIVRNGGWVNY